MLFAPLNRYATHASEENAQRPEEPLLFHQELGGASEGGIIEFTNDKVPIAGVRSNTDETLFGNLLCVAIFPTHEFEEQETTNSSPHTFFCFLV